MAAAEDFELSGDSNSELKGGTSQRSVSVFRRLSKLGDSTKTSNRSGSFLHPASTRSSCKRKCDFDAMMQDTRDDLDYCSIGERQYSFMFRLKRRATGSSLFDENSPEIRRQSTLNSYLGSRSHVSLQSRRRNRFFCHADDLMTEEQMDNIIFSYGDEKLEMPLVSLKRKVIANIKSYIQDIRVPQEEMAWNFILSAQDRICLREKQMEPPSSGEYINFGKLRDIYGHDGVFRCKGCRHFLFVPRNYCDLGQAWATFSSALPGALEDDLHPTRDHKYVNRLCRHCKGFIGVSNGNGGMFICSRSIYYHPMTFDEVELISRICARRLVNETAERVPISLSKLRRFR
eukprot:Plantae.Rhodophyta-Purpureofilum_apyrenoidigerum.ctg2819.p1 GENE.Plantae.Rhodophyta-Purpureofilum_apyrenoidigerum.ctg2819~~Plantae.Rhodophyta-Purpureofilum_apyrenoidigerum.ctg2819.p1  ORF type:complete len:345 (+),score=42.03 Plantae.Rhodophyta-Purpureofilum_apyrenoidigerum.ctg2819:277-1311(+)